MFEALKVDNQTVSTTSLREIKALPDPQELCGRRTLITPFHLEGLGELHESLFCYVAF